MDLIVHSEDDDFDNEECYDIEQAANNQFRTAFDVPRYNVMIVKFYFHQLSCGYHLLIGDFFTFQYTVRRTRGS